MQSDVPIPACFLADDATSADQLALAVFETAGGRVLTADLAAFCEREAAVDPEVVLVLNTGTRALAPGDADATHRRLTTRLSASERGLPVVQIDSRLRGVGKALKGLYDTLEFDLLVLVPAEPELGRLAQAGLYYHVENKQRIPFHQSGLAKSLGRGLGNSSLREFAATELGVAAEKVACLTGEVMSRGAEAAAGRLHELLRVGKAVAVPDVQTEEDFSVINAALRAMGKAKVLVAGSRTYLRSYLRAALATRRAGAAETLAGAVDRTRRGAPLALACSLEKQTTAQIDYAQRALGPNLVTLVFDSQAVFEGQEATRREVERVRGSALQALKAMRPVLVQSMRMEPAPEPFLQQKHAEALVSVLAEEALLRGVSALFVTGGETAQAVRRVAGIRAMEIRGELEAGVPWGLPQDGALKRVPVATKGGRLGGERCLFDFFEQGHPLPRANVLPVITPLTSRKQVDEAAIGRLVDYLVGLGTTDVFAVGNAGEFRFLSNAQRLQTLAAFARSARGRIRVFGGVTAESAAETRENYEAAGRLGLYAAVIMPLYFLKSSEEILPFVESLRSSVHPLPLVLYNNPERTRGQQISFEAAEALPFPVVGIKDSSGDPARLERYLAMLPVYQGQQRQFVEGYQRGMRGTIGIIGHVSALPNEFYAPTCSDVRRKEIATAINDLSKVVKQGGAEVAAYKYLLSLMGVTGDTVASNEPARELTPEQRDLIRTSNIELIRQGRCRTA